MTVLLGIIFIILFLFLLCSIRVASICDEIEETEVFKNEHTV